MVHRSAGEEELLGDLGVAVAAATRAEHLALARRQSGRVLTGRLPRAARDPRARRGHGVGAWRAVRRAAPRAPGAVVERLAGATPRRSSRSAPAQPRRGRRSAPTRRPRPPTCRRARAHGRPWRRARRRPRDRRAGARTRVARRVRISAAASAASSTALGRCVDIAGALLEPGDLGPRAARGRAARPTSSAGTPTARASSSAASAPGSPRRARTSASTTSASWCGHGDSRGSCRRRLGEIGRLGPATPVEGVARGVGQGVDVPQILVVRGAELDRLREVGIRERVVRRSKAEPAEVVERAGLLLGEAGRLRLGDCLQHQRRDRRRGRSRSSIVREPDERSDRGPGVATAERRSPGPGGRSRRRSRGRLRSTRSSTGARSTNATSLLSSRPATNRRRLIESLPCLPEEPSAEEVRAELRQIASLASRCALLAPARDRLSDDLDRLELVVREVAGPRASLEQLAASRRLGASHRRS